MDTIKFFLSHIILFGICVLPLQSFSQNVDSLILEYTDRKGKVSVKPVIDAGKDYVYKHPAVALTIAERILSIAEKQKEVLPLAQGYQFMGACYFQVKAEYDSASYYLQQAEQLYSSLHLKEAVKGRAMIFHNLGTIAQVKGNYAEAIDHYIRALKFFDETGETKLYAHTLNNIATLYALMNDFQKSEKYARDCIVLSQKEGDEFMTATGRIALCDALMAQSKYEEVIPLLEEVLVYGEQHNDPYKIFLYYLNYAKYLQDYQKDYPLAVHELEKARQLTESLGDEWEVMRHNSALSETYLLNNQFEEAHAAAQNALQRAEKLQSKDKQEIALWVLAQVSANNRDFETAYQQLHAAYLLKDTLFDESSRRHIAFLEAEYQTEKKEIRIETLEKERKLYWAIFIASVFALLWFLLALYLRHRVTKAKKELSEQQIIRLEKEKQLIATQANLEGEVTERSRLARDLHDGLGGMLSAVKLNLFDMKKGGAILASEDVLRFNKVLEMLDSSITELRRVAHNMMPESLSRYGLKVSLQDFCDNFPNVHFHFFGKDERLDNKLEVMIYRSVHELVNNALKYAGSDNINVQIVQQPDRVSLTVQDDGQGFDPAASTRGTGLTNIRTRAESVGGTMNIFSEPGKGAEINVEFTI